MHSGSRLEVPNILRQDSQVEKDNSYIRKVKIFTQATALFFKS